MIITIEEIQPNEMLEYLDRISNKNLLTLWSDLIASEQYEYCQEVLNEINKRKLKL